jgi:hypothetical protein
VKLNVTITGQDERRLIEHVDQLVRGRAATPQQPTEADPPPRASSVSPRRHVHRDRRS